MRNAELFGAVILGGGLLYAFSRSDKSPAGPSSPTSSPTPTPTTGETSALAIGFKKPLRRAVVTGVWGDPRPKPVGRYHYALDMPAKKGSPIFAAHSGTVIHADLEGGSTAGKYVVLRHASGISTRYLHQSSIAVRRDQAVDAGAVIGHVGSTGFSSGPHLHLDVFLSDRMLAVYRARYGTPTPTYPKKRRWGTQVPAEPLIPVDAYSTRAAKAAADRGIKTRTV